MGVSISGLSGSGIDTSSIITAIMDAEKVPLTKLQNKKEVTSAYKDFFTTLNTKMATLSDAATALSDLSTYRTYKATSSNNSILTTAVGNATASGNYSVNVTQLAQKQVVASQSFNTDTTFSASGLSSTLTIGEKTLYLTDDAASGVTGATSLGIKAETTMGDALSIIAKAINSTKDIGVSASVIQTTNGEKSLVLTASDGNKINGASELISNPDWKFAQTQEAKNAELTINGVPVTSETNTIENAVEGVTLKLTGTGSSTVEVSQDISSITSKVKTFVNAYNDVVTLIKNNTKKSTENDDGTLSLTLMGDSLLRDLQSKLNSMMNQIVGDTNGYKLLSDIGLEIDKGITSASLMTGNITFDSALFEEKLAANFDAVQKMFSATSSVDGKDGMATLFKNELKNWTNSVDGYITVKIKGYSSDLTYLGEQITNLSERLDMRQAALQKKYATMETMLATLNSQSDYVSNMLKSLTSSSD